MDEKENTAPQGEGGGRKRIPILDSDDVATVERKLKELCPNISETREENKFPPSSNAGPGRPPSEWHADAVEQIDKLVAAGATVQKAVRSIEGDFTGKYNVAEASIRTMYYDFKEQQRDEIWQSFIAHLVDGQFSKAAHDWLELDESHRKEFNSIL